MSSLTKIYFKSTTHLHLHILRVFSKYIQIQNMSHILYHYVRLVFHCYYNLLQFWKLSTLFLYYFAKLLNVVARQETLNRCRGSSVGRVISYFFGIFRVKFVEILQNLRVFFCFFFQVYLLGIPIQKLSSSNPWKDNVLKSWIVTLKVHTWCVNLNFQHTYARVRP